MGAAGDGRDAGDARYELKLACEAAAYGRVRMLLRLHPAGIRTLHPTRIVQSVYFDSTYGRALGENLAGISHREKLRFRWYGAGSDVVRGVLERKVRENMLGWKDVESVDADVAVEGARRTDFVRAIAARVARTTRDELLAREPVQWIRYRRDYLTTADGRVRVTLDRDVRTFDQRLRARLSCRAATRTRDLLVVELKCATADYAAARALASTLPLAVDRSSKFVLASDPVNGPVPSVFGA